MSDYKNGQCSHALTVDVEEYFQVGAFEHSINRSDWPSYKSRIAFQVDVLLELFASKEAKATFFCLGWIAEHHPSVIKSIAQAGHEIACHGYDHQRVFSMTAADFKADLLRAVGLLEDLTGDKVKGYRAPSFSIKQECFWAYEAMADLGITYSSSLYPVSHDHYGTPSSSRTLFKPVSGCDLVEIPPTTARLMGKNLPVAGGGYFRLFPYSLMKLGLKKAMKQLSQPANFYFHPWEIDPEQPHIKDAPLKSRFRHYVNQGKMLSKLDQLLDDFSWSTMHDVYKVGGDK